MDHPPVHPIISGSEAKPRNAGAAPAWRFPEQLDIGRRSGVDGEPQSEGRLVTFVRLPLGLQ